MVEELLRELELRLVVLRHSQQAARVLVNAVHEDAHALVERVGVLAQAQVMREGVDERALVVAVAGMDHHAGGFVDHEHVVIFIDDLQRNLLRDDLQAAAPVGHHEADHVAGPDDVVGLDGGLPHPHVAFLEGLLDAVAGGVLEVGGHIFVDPDGRLPRIHFQTEVLEHFLRLLLRHFFAVAGTLSGSVVRESVTSVPMRIFSDAAGRCWYTKALTESA